MFDSSSSDNPTPLAHADTSRDVLPKGEGEKDFSDDHRQEITDFVRSIPGFQECDEDVETGMACDAEDWISNAK
ncbi:hypothetical protein TNCV_2788681 [Trichonephila clavipes]|uniref:Uncharacterized protein n=1 Tax=Trichonephila clavipes TaxID=2585209 RepID=A0A8X6SYN6_TRICX|nr:hypothetical protein TNCV_2788681 [Trichonephila clavipes]